MNKRAYNKIGCLSYRGPTNLNSFYAHKQTTNALCKSQQFVAEELSSLFLYISPLGSRHLFSDRVQSHACHQPRESIEMHGRGKKGSWLTSLEGPLNLKTRAIHSLMQVPILHSALRQTQNFLPMSRGQPLKRLAFKLCPPRTKINLRLLILFSTR